MESGLLALAFVIMLTGVAGSFLPIVPGTPLILVGALLYAVATAFEPVGALELGVLAALTGIAYALEYVSSALGTRKLGGSRWAMGGAVVGGIVGLFFGPIGIITGPIVGAIGAELVHRKDVSVALRSGAGAVLGILLGVVAKLAIAVTMIGLFSFWVFRG